MNNRLSYAAYILVGALYIDFCKEIAPAAYHINNDHNCCGKCLSLGGCHGRK